MDLSVIIPVYNEEKNIDFLYRELKEHLNFIKKYEIIFVEDGSWDRSFKIIQEIAKKDKKVRIVKLKSNYGQSIAIKAGLDVCKGEKIIIMDGDCQHHPRYIVDFVNKLDDCDVVCNYRKNHRKSSSSIGNFLIRSLFKVKYKDSIGGMKGLTKQVKEEIYLYGNMHRYLPLLAMWKGFKVGQQPIMLRRRKSGRSHYKLFKGFKGFIDLLTVKFFVSYSTRPSHIFGSAGLLSSGLGGLFFLYFIIQKFFFGATISDNLPLFLTGILLILLGFNFIFFGLMGDMMSYNHLSKNNEKNYIIDKIMGKK